MWQTWNFTYFRTTTKNQQTKKPKNKRNVFITLQSALFIYRGSGSSSRGPPCCMAMFVQKPRKDKPNTDSKEDLSRSQRVLSMELLLQAQEGEGN